MATSRHFAITTVLLCLACLIVGCGSSSVAPPPAQEAPLLPPQNISITRSDNGDVIIAWDHSTQTNLKGYNIYRGLFRGVTFEKLNTSVITDNLYIDTTANPNTRYEYRLTAVSNKSFESNYTSVPFLTAQAVAIDKEKKKKLF